MLGRGAATQRADDAQAFAASVLHETPQIANVLFADTAGNFMLVRRAQNGPSGATETKHILQTPDHRSVEWTTRDAAGHVTARREDPSDTYDARTRSWFKGAQATDDVFWSGVYVFFSERAPGVTAAAHGPDDSPDVAGVDIRLDALSRFLGGLSIGRTGRAYIVDKDGVMVSGPDPARILRSVNDQLQPANIGDIGDAEAAGSWDHYRAQGPGDRIIDVGGRRMISIVAPLPNNSQGWLLLITVPEDEFSGFVTANSRRAAYLSLSVVALAVGLAALLVVQGLKADRSARTVADRSEAVRQQSAAFARLAQEAGEFDAAGKPPPALTETLAEATGARRAALWRLLGNGQVLRCEDSYEPSSGGHVAGLELSRQEVPALIEALARGEEINVADARSDKLTAALHASVMEPFGSTAMLGIPVMKSGTGIGLLLLEDSRRDPSAIDFARACATLVALQTPVTAEGPRLPLPRPRPTGQGQQPEVPDACLVNTDAEAPAQGQAVVLALRLPDAALARCPAGGVDTLAHSLACAAQETARTSSIPYVKMLGTMIIAAAGYGEQADQDAAVRLADMAITLRERCADMFDMDENSAAFGLGLDAGPVACGTVGSAPGVFNLWGEAARGAEALAASAPNGAIQTSEQAYRLLRQGFLFRPRGLFHRPRIGDARSYVLAGRA